MVSRPLTVLVLGGYGTFGTRLVRLLAVDPRLTIIVAGRSLEKARDLCQRLTARARLVALELDRERIEGKLRGMGVDVLVDASGPFQGYGENPYGVLQECLAQGVHYLDLADDAAFVAGVSAFDSEARRRGAFVLSGLSTFPTLSTAVVDRLSADMSRIDEIVAGLSPSPKAGLGGSVVRAIAAYAGKPISIVKAGAPATGSALIDARTMAVSPPGRIPLGPIRFTLIDVPDLATAPRRWPGVANLWFGVGTRPRIGQRILGWASRLVERGWMASLTPIAGAMEWFNDRVAWGAARGGMVISVSGLDAAGAPVRRSWHLVAEGDDGPFIPAMAAASVILSGLDKEWPADGARPGDRDVPLERFEAIFERFDIHCGVHSSEHAGESIYRRLLGDAWDNLPQAVRDLHSRTADHAYRGTASVKRGQGFLARVAARAFGFPPEAEAVPVTVKFSVRPDSETWERDFGGRRFASEQRLGVGSWEGLLSERFGPIEVGLAVLVEDGTLRLVARKWRAFGIPMPARFVPGGEAWEAEEDGRFAFHVDIAVPGIGRIVRYDGTLEPERPSVA